MPNWCENSITVNGTAKDLKRFDDQFKQKHASFSGGTGNRKPDEKEKKTWIAYRVNGNEYTYINGIKQKEGYSLTNFVEMTQDDFLNGWCNWSIRHWGTKWDVADFYENGMTDINEAIAKGQSKDVYELCYSFNTAWSPPEPVVSEMAGQYPELDFTHTYIEEGMGFAGIVEYHDGEELTRNEADYLDIRAFIHEHIDPERFTRCPHCQGLLEEYEIEEDDECIHCETPFAKEKA